MRWRIRKGAALFFCFLSRPPPQAARGLPLSRTQRRALTAAMLDSYAERCNDMMFSIDLGELDGPIIVHLMVME
jgi:hypothetical protein